MSANEIAERIAAHAWLRLGPHVGPAPQLLDAASIGFRSQVGFNETIITTENAEVFPLIILTLDREFSRTQNQVLAYTVGAVDTLGRNYPQPLPGNGPSLPNVQPIHMSWIGSLAAPAWLPFGDDVVPNFADLDLNRFNAIAILLGGETPGEGDFVAYAGDVNVLVLASPIQEGVTTVNAVIPLPA